MVEQHFCLRWNNYRTNITAEFETLREGEHFVDVTLACDGKQLKAHKVVLSACSPYFKELLQANPCSHPIIILRDVAYIHMRSLLEFMYAGEVNISQAHLGSFLHTAEALKIRGLAESSEDRKDQTRGCNSLSPLTALKTSLSNLGGISLCGLGPSMLERSLISHLPGYSHSGDSPTSNTKQSAPPQRVPTNLSLPSTSFTSPPPNSSCGALSTNSGSSFSKALSIEMQGPISLTTNSHMNDLSSRIKVEVNNEQKGSTSPLSLPPNKRIRLDPKIGLSKDNGPERLYENSQNGSSFTSTSSVSPADTATSKLSTSITASDTEDAADTVPKTEPLEPPASDTEGSGGCPEDGESGNGALGGRESPPDRAPSNSTSGIAISDSENASHLLQALSSESHLPGILRNFEPLPCPICQRSYSSPGNLKQHLENIHMASTEPSHQCRICGNKFKSKWYLHKHLHRAHHIRGRKEI